MYNMETHLLTNGYESYNIHYSNGEHTPTGTAFVILAASAIAEYVPAGMESVFSDMPKKSTHDIYSLDGRLLRRNAKISDTFTTLPKGIYIINGCKVVKE